MDEETAENSNMAGPSNIGASSTSGVFNYSQSTTISVQEPDNLIPLESSQDTETETKRTEDIPDERPAKKVKLNETFDDEGTICVICYESWGQGGDHRIASLRCGHLFGHKCIVRWLCENKVCPSCKKTAKKRDIRFIFANKLIAVDNGELTRMQGELQDLKQENMNLQYNLASTECRLANALYKLEKCLQQVKSYQSSQDTSLTKKSQIQLKYIDAYTACEHSSCRVMDFLYNKSTLVASVKSSTRLVAPFGVRNFNCQTYAPITYYPLHHKQIRDIRFSQTSELLLSVSLDKQVMVSNLNNVNSVLKYTCDDCLWSCSWDTNNTNIFYVGGQQGSVKIFDCRNLSDAIVTHSIDGDMSPVVSIVPVSSSPGSAMPRGGFLMCKLNSLWAIENTSSSSQVIKHCLPIEGPFISMTYSETDKNFLVTSRPNARESMVRNILFNTSKNDGAISANQIYTFVNGKTQKQMARSCFLKKDGVNYVASPNESSVQLWSTETGSLVSTSRVSGSIVDLMPMKSDLTSLLALSEKSFHSFGLIEV